MSNYQKEWELFKRFVSDNDSERSRLINKIAYSNYIEDRINYLKKDNDKIKSEEEQEKINNQMVEVFFENPNYIERLKKNAQEDVSIFLSHSVNNELKMEINKSNRFWKSVAASITATIIYSFTIALILFIITAATPNETYIKIAKALFTDAEIQLVYPNNESPKN